MHICVAKVVSQQYQWGLKAVASKNGALKLGSQCRTKGCDGSSSEISLKGRRVVGFAHPRSYGGPC